MSLRGTHATYNDDVDYYLWSDAEDVDVINALRNARYPNLYGVASIEPTPYDDWRGPDKGVTYFSFYAVKPPLIPSPCR